MNNDANRSNIESIIIEIVKVRGAVSVGHLHKLVSERLMQDYQLVLECMEATDKVAMDEFLVRKGVPGAAFRRNAEDHSEGAWEE